MQSWISCKDWIWKLKQKFFLFIEHLPKKKHRIFEQLYLYLRTRMIHVYMDLEWFWNLIMEPCSFSFVIIFYFNWLVAVVSKWLKTKTFFYLELWNIIISCLQLTVTPRPIIYTAACLCNIGMKGWRPDCSNLPTLSEHQG